MTISIAQFITAAQIIWYLKHRDDAKGEGTAVKMQIIKMVTDRSDNLSECLFIKTEELG